MSYQQIIKRVMWMRWKVHDCDDYVTPWEAPSCVCFTVSHTGETTS